MPWHVHVRARAMSCAAGVDEENAKSTRVHTGTSMHGMRMHVCARVRKLVCMHAHLHRQIRMRMHARTYMTRHNILIDMHA